MLYHPLKAWEHKYKKTVNGKALIGWKEPTIENMGLWRRIELPCGQCIGCRMDKAADWRMRCVLEAKMYEHNQFITLTYADEHTEMYKHWNPVIDTKTGEYTLISTLYKPDAVKFMKDLRRYYKYHFNHDGIRFYHSSEYGENTERGHFHFIVFNLPVPDLEPYFINHEGQQVYQSAILTKIWGKGRVTVGEVTYQSAAYVARYIMKKQTGDQSNTNRTPEFTNMSRNPGIGQPWYETHKDQIYKNDEVIIRARLGKAIRKKPSKYFDRLYDQTEPDRLEEVKKQRRDRAQSNRERKLTATSLSADQLLQVQENNYVKKISTLKRGMKEDI